MDSPYVLIDGQTWKPSGDGDPVYECIHAAAGAALAGAEEVQIMQPNQNDGN